MKTQHREFSSGQSNKPMVMDREARAQTWRILIAIVVMLFGMMAWAIDAQAAPSDCVVQPDGSVICIGEGPSEPAPEPTPVVAPEVHQLNLCPIMTCVFMPVIRSDDVVTGDV